MGEHRFYAIQTTAGHENKVRSLIARRIDGDPTAPETRLIRQALVPTQEVVEVKNGKKVTVDRKLYPGYVLVEMVWNQETAHVINSIQGVIKFLHHGGGHIPVGVEPMPLRQEEVNRLLGVAEEVEPEAPKEEIPFMIGQAVTITEGPFTDFNGNVEEVNYEKSKIRVSVLIFGRATPVELDFGQVEKA